MRARFLVLTRVLFTVSSCDGVQIRVLETIFKSHSGTKEGSPNNQQITFPQGTSGEHYTWSQKSNMNFEKHKHPIYFGGEIKAAKQNNKQTTKKRWLGEMFSNVPTFQKVDYSDGIWEKNLIAPSLLKYKQIIVFIST